jgi:hypothetical protein
MICINQCCNIMYSRSTSHKHIKAGTSTPSTTTSAAITMNTPRSHPPPQQYPVLNALFHGPSYSFVISDFRRNDHPVMNCSPPFSVLIGYSEHGRSCRFLQAPPVVPVNRGEPRRFTSPDTVSPSQLRNVSLRIKNARPLS